MATNHVHEATQITNSGLVSCDAQFSRKNFPLLRLEVKHFNYVRIMKRLSFSLAEQVNMGFDVATASNHSEGRRWIFRVLHNCREVFAAISTHL
jgi:hypothetical protein